MAYWPEVGSPWWTGGQRQVIGLPIFHSIEPGESSLSCLADYACALLISEIYAIEVQQARILTVESINI